MVDTVRNRSIDNAGAASTARWYARIVGIVLVLAGLIGFFTADPIGLNMDLTTVHNWVHLLTGAVALYFGFANNLDVRAVAMFALVFGVVYALIGVLGFFVTDVAGLILTNVDNWFHILVGLFGVVAGIASMSATRSDLRTRRPAI